MKAKAGGIYAPMANIGVKGQRMYVLNSFMVNSNKLNESPLVGHSVSERINTFLNIYSL